MGGQSKGLFKRKQRYQLNGESERDDRGITLRYVAFRNSIRAGTEIEASKFSHSYRFRFFLNFISNVGNSKEIETYLEL